MIGCAKEGEAFFRNKSRMNVMARVKAELGALLCFDVEAVDLWFLMLLDVFMHENQLLSVF